MNVEETAALVTSHLDRAVTQAKRLAELLHHRPTRTELDLEAAAFLVYVTWLLENDSDSRKLSIRMTSRIGKTLAEMAVPTHKISSVGDAERIEAAANQRIETARNLQRIAESEARDFRKRWHEAATQRDTLVRAAQDALAADTPTEIRRALDALGEGLTQVEAGGGPHATPGYKLRRELWHVLDRMPSSDADLIAAVKKLKEGQR